MGISKLKTRQREKGNKNSTVQGGWTDCVSLLINNIDIKFYVFFFLLISLVHVSLGRARLKLPKYSAN